MNRTRPITSLLLFILFSISLPSASAASAEKSAPTYTEKAEVTTLLLHDPVPLKRYEAVTQALQAWYASRSQNPALLLYSDNPLLQPTSPSIQRDLMERLANNDARALRFNISNPVILPGMTLRAALNGKLFSAVYWVMPTEAVSADLSVEAFRTQMQQIGAISEEEAQSLSLHDGVFSGTVEGVPFSALQPQAKVSITAPAVVHFDLSYFSPLYKSEIKTPIFPLVYETFKGLRDQKIKTLTVGLSYSQVSEEIPLSARFLGNVLAELCSQPIMLDSPPPSVWKQRANALYLAELFNVREAQKALLKLVKETPDDPSVHYALYQLSRESKDTYRASLGHLADAVKLEPIYAIEYLSLSPVAREKGFPDEAIRVLHLAHEALPEDPLVALELINALMSARQFDLAVPILKGLLSLKWSATFYPGIPGYLQRLLDEASGSDK